MNKIKKEEKRKYDEARKGLTNEQVEALNVKEKKQQEIHADEFPEEYNYQYDSISDAKDRANGTNPMSQEYIDKINSKRVALGVTPLSESGMPISNDTMAICIEKAKKLLVNNQ